MTFNNIQQANTYSGNLATSDRRRWPWSTTKRRRRVSVGLCLFVVALVEREEVFEFPLECLESWSAHWVLVPALQHDFIQGGSAIGWAWHTITVLYLAKHLSVCHAWIHKRTYMWTSRNAIQLKNMCITWIGNASVCDQFGEQNTETPHIRLNGKFAVVCCFRCCPLNRETSAHASLILILFD